MTTTWKKPKGPPLDYFVPNFGVDQDILDTQEHIRQSEQKLGKWNVQQDEYGNYVVPAANNDVFKFR